MCKQCHVIVLRPDHGYGNVLEQVAGDPRTAEARRHLDVERSNEEPIQV